MDDFLPIINDHEEPPFFEYRSPYAWQTRKLQFNKEMFRKLNNNIEKYASSKQIIKNNHFSKLNNWPEETSSSSSIASSFISSNDHLKPIVDHKRLYPNMTCNNNIITKRADYPYFIRIDKRMYGQATPWNKQWSSSKDIRDYYGHHHHHHNHHPRPYIAYPYIHPLARTNPFMFYPSRYYSSQTFYPAAYFPIAMYDAKRTFLGPPNKHQQKGAPVPGHTSLYQHRSSLNDHYHSRTRLLSSNGSRLTKSPSSTNNHHLIIIMAVVFTVIIIGVIMGLILAITIN